jgi:carbon monoxide dehydrogenase subunit G
MKKLSFLLIAFTLITITAVAQKSGKNKVKSYGEAFTAENVISLSELQEKMKSETRFACVFEGSIVQTCQKAGCWMEVAMPVGDGMTVFMKDHAFAVPLEKCEGKKTYVKGEAYFKELTVAYLQHLAEDAGKSKEEIAKITEPQKQMVFNASGVQIVEGKKGGKRTMKGENCAH